VAGRETARKALDPALPSNALIERATVPALTLSARGRRLGPENRRAVGTRLDEAFRLALTASKRAR